VGVKSRRVGFVFKFMLWEMFDVASLDPKQLEFNVTFAVGGIPPRERRTDVGTMAFGFEKREETILLVITGFQGPSDGAGRPTALIATYSLSDPETAHDLRLAKLVDEARRELKSWHARP
jgi:hypothetical protein